MQPAPLEALARSRWSSKVLAFEAVVMLALARIDSARSAAHYTAILGKAGREAASPTEQDERTARRIGHIVLRVSRYMPFRAVCLQQAIATRRMLRRRNVPATVFLGVTPDLEKWGKSRDTAHAWVVSGSSVVSGLQGDLDEMIVVGRFA